MLQGIEQIFADKDEMLKHLKKKNFEKNSEEFLRKFGHYFMEMSEYVTSAENKDAAAKEIGQCIAGAVKEKYTNKRGKIDSRTQIDLNFFMIYYVFPTILSTGENGKVIADGVRDVWSSSFKDADIQYTDYNSLYNSFREKIFGIFQE